MVAKRDLASVAASPDTSRGGGWSWTQRPLWLVGLGAATLAAVAGVAVYAVARIIGVPMELTEVFENHFARMPVLNMA
jgi:hypothetical protein